MCLLDMIAILLGVYKPRIIMAYEEPCEPLQQKKRVIFRNFCRFLPEESDKLGWNTSV